MARKVYLCDRWPWLRIAYIKFRDGKFTTEDEDAQRMIENNVAFGVHIQLVEEQVEPQPLVQEEAAPRRGPGRPPGGGARQGQTGTGNLRPQGE